MFSLYPTGAPASHEAPNRHDLADGDTAYALADYYAGQVAHAYPDGSGDLHPSPVKDKPNGQRVKVADPLGRNEKGVLRKINRDSDGCEWEARYAPKTATRLEALAASLSQVIAEASALNAAINAGQEGTDDADRPA